jgi:DNA-binding NarL/FixJ family response regulator
MAAVRFLSVFWRIGREIYSMRARIGVLAAGDDREFLHGLEALLQGSADFQCLGLHLGCLGLEEAALKLKPRLILMDSRCIRDLPGEVMKKLRGSLPGVVVGLLDLEDGPLYHKLAVKAGADLFVCKSRVEESLGKIKDMMGMG